jgi:uncharacterized membrane protein YeaQ/YmgE (transglycosylase-associated protein family)
MKDAITMMLVASILGALVGVYLATVANPINNYFYFMAFFAIIGAGLANVVLLVLVKIYCWFVR